MRPNLSTVFLIHSSTESLDPTSTAVVRTLDSASFDPPVIVATAASRRSFCKSASERLAPRSKRIFEVARAIPEAAPVTAITLFESGNAILSGLNGGQNKKEWDSMSLYNGEFLTLSG